MNNLLRADFYTIKRSKSIYVCVGISILLLFASVFLYNYIGNISESSGSVGTNSEGVEIRVADADSGTFSTSSFVALTSSGLNYMHSVIVVGDELSIFLAICMALFVVSQFTNGTIKNIASKGFGREQIYFSKLITISVVTFIIFLVYYFIGLLVSSIFWGLGTITGKVILELIRFAALQCLLLVAMSSIFVFLGMVFRNNAASIAIGICLFVFVPLLYTGLNYLVKGDFDFTTISLIQNMKFVTSLEPTNTEIFRSIGVAFGYTAVTSGLGCLIFKKRDI